MTKDEKLKVLIEKLFKVIYTTISDGLKKDTLQPQYLKYFRWKLTDFEYTDTGIAQRSAEGEEILKPIWGLATLTIYKQIIKLNEYNDILKLMSQDYKLEEHECNLYLEQLIKKVTSSILEGKVKRPKDSAKYAISFLKDLNGGKQEYRAEVLLKGLLLRPCSIQLNSDVILRKPTRKDFEREVLMTFPSHGDSPLTYPTAFLHVRVHATEEGTALHDEINKGIAILKLFRVGAVQYLQYSSSTDSIIHMAGGRLTSGRLLGSDKYLITEEDIKQLSKYWRNMTRAKLPSSVYHSSQEKPDEISIAYDRYGDSLEGHIIEKRISSAVMGLEALYLTEMDELSYRLRMRVGKLLGIIGYKQTEVRERMKDAYEVRSGYVHGRILKPKERQKLERKYGNLNDFSKTIMDYLRASIVALLGRPSKTSLIQKIDDSFLDDKKEEEIKKLLFMPY